VDKNENCGYETRLLNVLGAGIVADSEKITERTKGSVKSRIKKIITYEKKEKKKETERE
jgi:hypothetical protein